MEGSDENQLKPLFRRHVPRPRLTQILDESKAQSIVLTAPAGYGKTTLVQEWLRPRSDAVWYRATAASADLAAFSAGVADIVAPLVPGAGERLKQRLRIADSPERATRPLAELLSEDLSEWPASALLVVDDYHLVMDSAPVEDFVDWVLTLTPHLRVVVTTRRRPRWASARRILYGEITEIGREQLAMNHEEASRVLAEHSTEAVRALVTQAEGWPVLIGLAALSESAELPEERVSDALFRYFAEEVFRAEEPDVQRFMLLASIPATVTPRAAREILGFDEPGPLIDHLSEVGLLSEAGPGDSRFHPLLRDFLRKRLEADDPQLVASLTERALDDARHHRAWDDAFELAHRGRNWDAAAEVISDAADDLLAAGRVETLAGWIDDAGVATTQFPGALLTKVEVLTRQGRLTDAAGLALDQASRLDDSDPAASRAWYLAGQALHLVSEEQRALECHLRARNTAQTRDDQRRALWGACLAAWELEAPESSAFLRELEAYSDDNVNTRLRLSVGRVLAAERSGTFAGQAESVAALMPIAKHADDPMARTSFIARAADVYIGRSEYDRALELANEAVELCTRLHLIFARDLCVLIRGSAEIGAGEFRSARTTLTELLPAAQYAEDPYLRFGTANLALKLQLALRQPVDFERPIPNPQLQRTAQGEFWGLLAIGLATSGEAEDARRSADRARKITGSVEPHYYASFAELIVTLRMPDMDAATAVSKVEEAVLASDADAFLEAFHIAYRAFPALLGFAARSTTAAPIARRIAAAGRDDHLARDAGLIVTAPAFGVTDPLAMLTPREHEVARLIARGDSNDEIARALVITRSTAKLHVRHILRKLPVQSRLQAALWLRERLDAANPPPQQESE